MSQKNKSRFIPDPVTIWLGSGDEVREYQVTPAPWSSLFRLKDFFRELLSDVTTLWNANILPTVKAATSADDDKTGTTILSELMMNDQVWVLVDKLLEKPYEIFSLAIPDLDPHLFDKDNPKGATIPQIWETFNVISEVNKLDVAKNLITSNQVVPPKN